MQKITANELKSFLWDAANLLRGKIDSGDFKHYILGLLFYKRLSDVFDEEYEKAVKRVGKELAVSKDLYGEIFYIPEKCSWKDVLNTKINMILHGYNDATIERGDTFAEPKHLNPDGSLMTFNIVLANPPWNLKNWLHHTSNISGKSKVVEIDDKYNRLIYGRPPASSADWAWLQHMLASLKDGGRMGIVMDNGVLFRGSKEGMARKGFIENDLIEAVIGLPANLFANTGSPGCLLICHKNKPVERKNKALFIDASKDYLEGKAQNHLRDEDVEKTFNTFTKYETKERYCSVCDIEEIRENDYNLNISRYVDTTEPEEMVVVENVLKNLKKLEAKRKETDKKLQTYLVELGYKYE